MIPSRERSPTEFVRAAMRRRVTAVFNDATKGERPVMRRADALFPPDSVAWRVHGDVVCMLTGGIASLMLQMLHPKVLAGVWDHSDFRADMHGRLKRTAKFISVTTFDSAPRAEALLERINAIHGQVRGVLPNGEPYDALDPRLLAWVHVTEAMCFLEGWRRYGEPDMSRADQDRYFDEMARIAGPLGADPIPRSRGEAEAFIQIMRPELVSDERTQEVRDLVLRQNLGAWHTAPAARVIMAAGVDLLPAWARQLHRLPRSPVDAFAAAQAKAMARTVRWAYATSANVRVWPQDVREFPWR
ncbi:MULTISPECIES: oxygenase MpaB family protein [Brevundimonas]|uniref:oxygenase MpaB family protein n=1 Tax=Brevundimonas TaxID=41275 RepID=UPI000F022CBA|nr:oxygenase MpaB family protein [Brevundimonas lutea]